MANDKRVSELPDASTPLSGEELIPVVQDGSTRKTTVQEIANLGGGGGEREKTPGILEGLYPVISVDEGENDGIVVNQEFGPDGRLRWGAVLYPGVFRDAEQVRHVVGWGHTPDYEKDEFVLTFFHNGPTPIPNEGDNVQGVGVVYLDGDTVKVRGVVGETAQFPDQAEVPDHETILSALGEGVTEYYKIFRMHLTREEDVVGEILPPLLVLSGASYNIPNDGEMYFKYNMGHGGPDEELFIPVNMQPAKIVALNEPMNEKYTGNVYVDVGFGVQELNVDADNLSDFIFQVNQQLNAQLFDIESTDSGDRVSLRSAFVGSAARVFVSAESGHQDEQWPEAYTRVGPFMLSIASRPYTFTMIDIAASETWDVTLETEPARLVSSGDSWDLSAQPVVVKLKWGDREDFVEFDITEALWNVSTVYPQQVVTALNQAFSSALLSSEICAVYDSGNNTAMVETVRQTGSVARITATGWAAETIGFVVDEEVNGTGVPIENTAEWGVEEAYDFLFSQGIPVELASDRLLFVSASQDSALHFGGNLQEMFGLDSVYESRPYLKALDYMGFVEGDNEAYGTGIFEQNGENLSAEDVTVGIASASEGIFGAGQDPVSGYPMVFLSSESPESTLQYLESSTVDLFDNDVHTATQNKSGQVHVTLSQDIGDFAE